MNIYWDLQTHRLVGGMNDTSQIPDLTWVLRDKVPVKLYLLQPSTGENAYEAVLADAGKSVIFGAKEETGLSGPHLIYCGEWTLVAGTVPYYTAVISLERNELITAIGTSPDLIIETEFRFLDAEGNRFDGTQHNLTVKADVNRGNEIPTTGVYSSCLVVQIVEDGQKVILIQNTDGVVYLRLTIPGG